MHTIFYTITNILLPPLGMMVYLGKTKRTYFSLLLWCYSLYVFAEQSAVYGFLLYVLLIIMTFRWASKSTIKSLQLGTVEIIFMSILAIIGTVFTIKVFEIEISSEKMISDLGLPKYDIQESKGLFMQKCGACHQLTEEHSIGPGLKNIVSREAGSHPNYNYSLALENADFIWTEAKLKQLLENPNSVVPGSRMVLAPMEEEDINAIVEFLGLPHSQSD